MQIRIYINYVICSLVYEPHTGVHGFLGLFPLGEGLVGGREELLVPSRGAAGGHQYPFREQRCDEHASLVESLQSVCRGHVQLFRRKGRYVDGRRWRCPDHTCNRRCSRRLLVVGCTVRHHHGFREKVSKRFFIIIVLQ